MKKGRQVMKYLEINNNKVFFFNESEEKKPIDLISKEDVMYILEKSLEDDYEFDPYDDEKIGNQAHNIIYKEISKKIQNMIKSKGALKDEVDSLYKDAWLKYCKD